ncbi:MAG: D-alanine--D-alanine ligase [Ignavibacteriales bacterium]|nr:D-alanine--D-alanine ligase [Ignavibacteriales bacterium]
MSPQRENDKYAEWDSWETIHAVELALAEQHDVTLIEADVDAYQKLLDTQPDIVFNIAEGMNGVSREAQIPAMLEYIGIPYSGSDPLTLAICLDKSRAKEILSFYHINNAKFQVLNSVSELSTCSVSTPCMVKPLHEGSSKGIYDSSLAKNQANLFKEVETVTSIYQQPALIEEFLSGREFTVAVMGNGNEATCLPIVEIKFDSLPEGVNPIYSYEAKWIFDRPESPLEIFECPANLSPSLKHEIEQLCISAYTVLRCKDWCRIDVRLDAKGTAHILELNPLPGILPNPEDNSCLPKAARAAGMNYNQLIQTTMWLATKRYGLS